MEAHSSNVPTSQASSSSHHEKNRKMKGKVVENESPPKLEIDLNKTPSELEGDLLNSPGNSSSSDESEPALSKTYDCAYCIRKFATSQALAGHCNAHKQRRGQTTRRRANPSNPLHGSNLNRSLGVRMDSLINKPTSVQSLADSSSNMLQRMRAACNRLRMRILQQQTRASEFVRVFPSPAYLNAANNWANVGGRLGVFPPPATNTSAGINRAANVGDPSGLDLTLKL